jgi:hypothetical protein
VIPKKYVGDEEAEYTYRYSGTPACMFMQFAPEYDSLNCPAGSCWNKWAKEWPLEITMGTHGCSVLEGEEVNKGMEFDVLPEWKLETMDMNLISS